MKFACNENSIGDVAVDCGENVGPVRFMASVGCRTTNGLYRGVGRNDCTQIVSIFEAVKGILLFA